MTQPDGLFPTGAANYSSFAAFAGRTEAEWRAEIEGRTTSPFASILGGLFSGLPTGMPQPIALLSVLLQQLLGVTLTWSNNPADFVNALKKVPILGDLAEVLTGVEDGDLDDLGTWVTGLLTGASLLDAGNLINLEDIGEIAQDKITDLTDALSGIGSDIQDTIDTVHQALTDTLDGGITLAAMFDALRNIPATSVAGWGGPADIAESIQQTWDQWISGLADTPIIGASLADLFNIGQDVSSRANLGMLGWDILGIRNNKSLSTGFLPTSESNIALDKIALQASAPTFALTQSTAITAFQRISEAADKQTVSWMGSGVTNVTNAYVNIWQMDTTTGLSTLVHASADIVGLLSSTMQYNVYELPDPISVLPGEVYGIEICIRGAGTHSIAGQSTWLPDHPTVFPRRMSAVRNSGTSAPPSTIAHSSLVYSSNVPFVEFAVSSGDPGVPHTPRTDFFSATGTVPIPSWANIVEVIAVGAGGGGRQGGTWGLHGEGGNAGSWSTATWTRGTHFTGTPSVSVTIPAGGAGGSSGVGHGAAGGNTVVAITGYTVTATGGAGGDTLGAASNRYGRSPGNTTYNSVVYAGGGVQNTSGSPGAAPGGGGSGGNDVFYQHAGDGARGGAWLRFTT